MAIINIRGIRMTATDLFKRGDRVRTISTSRYPGVDYYSSQIEDFALFLEQSGFAEAAIAAHNQEFIEPEVGWRGAVLAHPIDRTQLWTGNRAVAVAFDNEQIGLIVRDHLEQIFDDPDSNY